MRKRRLQFIIYCLSTWRERALEINIRYPTYLAATIVAPLPADERVPANATPPVAYDGGIVNSLLSANQIVLGMFWLLVAIFESLGCYSIA